MNERENEEPGAEKYVGAEVGCVPIDGAFDWTSSTDGCAVIVGIIALSSAGCGR